MSLTKQVSLFALLLAVVAGSFYFLTGGNTSSSDTAIADDSSNKLINGVRIPVDVKLPELSFTAANGKIQFDANCAACHGTNGAGTQAGPPLIHKFYNPGHHDDAAFYRAVKQGTPRHHWNFGDMPPRPNVTPAQVKVIISFIREVQLANGIKYQKHG